MLLKYRFSGFKFYTEGVVRAYRAVSGLAAPSINTDVLSSNIYFVTKYTSVGVID